jgi:hypothetical protein
MTQNLCKSRHTVAVRLKLISLTLVGLYALVLFVVDVRAQSKSTEELRVLFIGNSLTYENDLPDIVKVLAEKGAGKRLKYKMIAKPNFGLIDHWDGSEAREEIARKKWDVVVLQQGPSASSEGRESLLKYSRLFADDIRKAGAKPALYMVWPSAARFNDFDRVSESYALAAKETGAILFRVGDAWRAAWQSEPGLRLYSSDQFHPSYVGSYLAALVIVTQLCELPPDRLKTDHLPSGKQLDHLTVSQLTLLHKAAMQVTTEPR